MLLNQEACMIGIVLIISPINSCDQGSDVVTGLGKLPQQYPTLLRRVQKLGAYYGVTWRVRTLLNDPGFFRLGDNVLFVEISFPWFFFLFYFGFLAPWSHDLSKISSTAENLCRPPESG